MYDPQSQQGSGFNLNQGNQGISIDGVQGNSSSGGTLQVSNGTSQRLQPTANPMNYVDPEANTGVLGANTQIDSAAAAAAAAQAAADAARAAGLRGQITDLVGNINSLFGNRYGQVDALGKEQTGKLNTRFQNEQQDITHQIEGENQKIGAAHASSGTYDSSYRGNNVDTVTHAGEGQIRDLGQELSDNLAKVAAWISSQKTDFNSQKEGYANVVKHLAEETDPGRLTDLRNTIESKLTELKGKAADYQTEGAQGQALAAIAPSSARAVQLKTTLSQVIAGNADASQKSAIGESLIANSGLTPDEQKSLLGAFTSDLSTANAPQTDQSGNVVSA